MIGNWYQSCVAGKYGPSLCYIYSDLPAEAVLRGVYHALKVYKEMQDLGQTRVKVAAQASISQGADIECTSQFFRKAAKQRFPEKYQILLQGLPVVSSLF